MKGKNIPGPVRITEVREMPLDFHARFDSKGKTYIYRIRNCNRPDVFQRNYCYQITQPLDVQAMQKAAVQIMGKHDFACFQASGGNERETTVRTVYRLEVRQEGQDIYIIITGDGFLYNMVRIITGTLVEAGLGKRKPASVAAMIKSKKRQNAGHTAPPQGLYLKEVYYEFKEMPGYDEGTPGMG